MLTDDLTRGSKTTNLAGLLMVLYPLLPETPYWLVLNGDLDGADAVLQRMAKTNGVPLPQVTHCSICHAQDSGWHNPAFTCSDKVTGG